ncbi:hypothetical protein DYB31_010053 [Aphanomyces astaci]|uniref:Phosphatidic acid phosphatase type 2/haloperoxidase domain-containing protein n=1 Tax=Aphanomyces astaci TaxID=112090 RepID=A0A397FD71_APHAT|nr:hypothetical protein DYB31_010053 [Aphanomyces astaci]
MAGMTLQEKLVAFRVWELITSIVVIGGVFAITSSTLYLRPIPHVAIQLNATYTIYARDPSLDLTEGVEQVPLSVAIAIYYATPLLVHAAFQWHRFVMNDTRDFMLTLAMSTAVCQLLTHFGKVTAGRFRPSFYDMCDWDTSILWDGVANLCRNPKGEAEGRKSFPSGHASGAFSTLFLVTLYLLGRSKLLAGSALATQRGFLASVNFFLALVPTVVAMWISITRSQDNWHHYSDILVYLLGCYVSLTCVTRCQAGSVIGILASILAYCFNYGSLFDYKSAGMPLETLRDLKEVDVPAFNDLQDSGLRTELADLNARLRVEVEAKRELQRLRARDKERFADEFSQFEARLLRANETLEKNRQIVEASLVEKDNFIEQLQIQLDKKQHAIDCLKQDPRLLHSSRRRRQAQPPIFFDHMNGGDSMNGGSDNGVKDSKVHELELQMSKLFVQLQEAHTKNDAQDDLIEGMKAANAKLVASLKKMKHKLKEATDSGVNHMFHDMTRKCMRAEAEKAAVEATLVAAQSETLKIESKADTVSRMVTMYASGDPPPPVEQLQALLLDLENEEGVVSCDPLASDQEGKQRILMSLMQSQAILDGVAHHLAQGCARFLGSNCALQ